MVMNTQQKEIIIFAPKLNLNHNIYMSTIRAEVREKPEIFRHKQDSNNDSCDAGAVLGATTEFRATQGQHMQIG